MKNKIGFNLTFAMLAFPIALALFREFDFATFTFKKKVLGFLYLITLIFCIVCMLKKKQQPKK
jgi:lipopolysaccharide export LptBFGC system permease protein LptF